MEDEHIITIGATAGGRDQKLRMAHREAFDQIRRALLAQDREIRIREAVEELIDACEDYLRQQRN